MTDEALARLWIKRRTEIGRILDALTQYKECGQCRSVSVRSIGRCPICGGYRFIEDVHTVAATAREMLKSPIPFTVAVSPRL